MQYCLLVDGVDRVFDVMEWVGGCGVVHCVFHVVEWEDVHGVLFVDQFG